VYFISRYELGKTLASKVQHLRGSEPIIVSLKDSGLLTAISVASKVRGWVYPLLTEQLVIPGDDRSSDLSTKMGSFAITHHYQSLRLKT
jgi:predicted phosphoribosyltransferase